MSNDNTTLADVQPGGMVRLGDQAERARFEAWAGDFYHLQHMGEKYRSAITTDAWAAWQAALSAQPSPGGQGAPRCAEHCQNGRAEVCLASQHDGVVCPHDSCDIEDGIRHNHLIAARQPVDENYEVWAQNAENVAAELTDERAIKALRFAARGIRSAARQPVGEPVTVEAVATVRRDGNGDHYIDWLTEGGIADLEVGDVLMVSDRAITDEDGSGEVYAAPPAQLPAQVYLDGLDRALGEAIDQRDRYHEVADDLAGHIAAITGVDIGEHSSANCPWQNAIEAAEEYKPAQAVDLPYSLDADPAGIRARVADVITGTLMVGAQGHTPPPAGHWAEPFWQAARADATAQAVDLGQPVPVIARALAEWHEDDGNVLWWAWCGRDWAGEPAWAGTPNDSDWPGYHTHWTPHPSQPALIDSQAVGNG